MNDTTASAGAERMEARRGVALPLVLLVLTVLSIVGAGAMVVVGGERRVAGSAEAQTQAYALARSGIDRFLADRASFGFSGPPARSESTRVTLGGGYADVVLDELRPELSPLTPAVYVLRAHGVRTDGAGRPIAERTLAQYARWQEPSMQVLAAWTSLRGAQVSGPNGTINGLDACGAAAAVAGVAVPTAPGYTQVSGASLPVGSPNVLALGTPSQTATAVTVDWATVVSTRLGGTALQVPQESWPTATQWGDPRYWPVVVVNGDFALPSDGHGALIVTGDLSVSGARQWSGVVLVGGSLTTNGELQVQGAMVTGLSAKFAGSAGPTDDVNGTLEVQFNSCNVARALAPFRGLSALRNATIDSWSY
jgi:hypothetical protein